MSRAQALELGGASGEQRYDKDGSTCHFSPNIKCDLLVNMMLPKILTRGGQVAFPKQYDATLE